MLMGYGATTMLFLKITAGIKEQNTGVHIQLGQVLNGFTLLLELQEMFMERGIPMG